MLQIKSFFVRTYAVKKYFAITHSSTQCERYFNQAKVLLYSDSWAFPGAGYLLSSQHLFLERILIKFRFFPCSEGFINYTKIIKGGLSCLNPSYIIFVWSNWYDIGKIFMVLTAKVSMFCFHELFSSHTSKKNGMCFISVNWLYQN